MLRSVVGAERENRRRRARAERDAVGLRPTMRQHLAQFVGQKRIERHALRRIQRGQRIVRDQPNPGCLRVRMKRHQNNDFAAAAAAATSGAG